MTLLETIEMYGKGKGESVMWKTIEQISDYLEEHRDVLHDVDELLCDVYGHMCNGHYNDVYAQEALDRMYYIGKDGQKHHAPYWTKDETREAYRQVKSMLPDGTNEHDFAVAINMLMSDYHNLLEEWFPGMCKEKALEMVVQWYNDPDSPHGNKVWNYMH